MMVYMNWLAVELRNNGRTDIGWLASDSTREVLNRLNTFDEQPEEDKPGIQAVAEKAMSDAGQVKDASDRTIFAIAEAIKKHRLWENVGLSEQEYRDAFPRYDHACRNDENQKKIRSRLVTQIVTEWGDRGLHLISKNACSLEELLEMIRTRKDDTFAKNVLQQLSNAAKLLDFDTAAKVFQVANFSVLSGTVSVEESTTRNANVFMAALLRKNGQDATVGASRLSPDEKADNIEAILPELDESLEEHVAKVGARYITNLETWEFDNPKGDDNLSGVVARIARGGGRTTSNATGTGTRRKRRSKSGGRTARGRKRISPEEVSESGEDEGPNGNDNGEVTRTSSRFGAVESMRRPNDGQGCSPPWPTAEQQEWQENTTDLSIGMRKTLIARHLEQAIILAQGGAKDMGRKLRELSEIVLPEGKLAPYVDYLPQYRVGLWDALVDIRRDLERTIEEQAQLTGTSGRGNGDEEASVTQEIACRNGGGFDPSS